MEKGEKRMFHVKGSKVAGMNMYFQINWQGREYDIKAFDFQRKTRPQTLQCIVKEIDAQGFPVFRQDFAAIIPQIYKKGEVYEFRVKSGLMENRYHEVTDWNGLIFRVNPNGERIHVNEVIKCKVLDIKDMRVELELVTDAKHGIPLFTLDEFLSLDSTGSNASKFLKRIFFTQPLLSDAREQLATGNPLWVMTVADAVARNFTDWLCADFRRDDSPLLGRGRREHRTREQRLAVITAFNSICINLLENSPYLRECSPRERIEYQDRLNRIITNTGDYVKAVGLMVAKRDQTFIDETMDRLKLSGYLYNPEERMRVAMALFSLRRDSVSNYIDDIFDIICDSHGNHRFMHLFAKAFVEMLDMYISNESRHIDVLTSTTERTAIVRIIKALSLRLLLYKERETERIVSPEGQEDLYRSMLYRYVTLLSRAGADNLLDKALSTLFGPVSPLEFTWTMLGDINMFASRVASTKGGALPSDSFVFEGNNALMAINGRSFTFSPVIMGDRMSNALPGNLFGLRDIRILLNDRVEEKIKPSRNDILQFKRLWKEIERSLFAPYQNIPKKSEGIRPDVGDTVTIRIVGKVPGRRYEYRAIITDDSYVGEGIITPKQMVSYPIEPSEDMFRDKETGDYCLYRATVESRLEDGKFLFNMREDIHHFLRENLEVGSTCNLQVSMIQPDRFLCISESGFSCFVYKQDVSDFLKVGDFIEGTIEEIFPNPVIRISYDGRSEERFTQSGAMKWLLDEYCGDRLYHAYDPGEGLATETEIEEARASRNFIDLDQMRELILLIDREGMMRNDHIETYNYLAVARIMSMLIGDAHQAAYFANRMDLVETICLFGDNGKIDDERLEKLLSDNQDFISSYPDIESRLTRLRIINHLDKPWKADWLWRLACDTPDEKTSHLARLVLSYNMLSGSNIFEARSAIRRRIYQLMDVKIQVSDNERVAEEDQFTELKTSIIYPAGNHMFANEREQLTEILKVVSSFLNAKGGRLLIGVDDSGYPVGLHQDFTYLNDRNEKYDLADVKDKFDRKVRDAVRTRMGRVANGKISGSFESIGSKIIYRLDIEASPEVALVDGIAYERQGTSKWPVPASELKQFTSERANMNN